MIRRNMEVRRPSNRPRPCRSSCLAALGLLFATTHAGWAAQWYVSTTGTPTAAGTIGDPWNLQRALAGDPPIAPGDTIWVRGGHYIGPFSSYLQGTPIQPIIVRNYQRERVLLDSQYAECDPSTCPPAEWQAENPWYPPCPDGPVIRNYCVEGIQAADHGAGADAVGTVRRYAATAREQLLRCRSTIGHFLRLASGKQGEATSVNVAAVVRLSQPAARARVVSLRVVAAGDGVRVRGNEADLQHILLNLILNAVEASPPGGEVRLTVAAGNPVRIRIADDGPGVAQGDEARIFEPFVSLRPDGIGLGLFLALSFARRWGADIRVLRGLAAGATFEVAWPALEPEARDPAEATMAAGVAELRP